MADKSRGYDSSELFRDDTILRIRQLELEIQEIQREIRRIEKNLPAGERREKRDEESACVLDTKHRR